MIWYFYQVKHNAWAPYHIYIKKYYNLLFNVWYLSTSADSFSEL